MADTLPVPLATNVGKDGEPGGKGFNGDAETCQCVCSQCFCRPLSMPASIIRVHSFATRIKIGLPRIWLCFVQCFVHVFVHVQCSVQGQNRTGVLFSSVFSERLFSF